MSKEYNICDLLKLDIRTDAFKKCIRFINYELVDGDILEFGVYSGRSLAALSYYNDEYYKNENEINAKTNIDRKIYGFDSFEGLSETEDHPRWSVNLFKYNHSYHPTIKNNELVTPTTVENFFSFSKLKKPIIIKSYFDKLNIDMIDKIALCHIDCDLYSSTKQVLNLIKDKLVNGSILMFDDWFHHKGDHSKGEQKAVSEFLDENKNIKLNEFERYGTFCKAFIVNIL